MEFNTRIIHGKLPVNGRNETISSLKPSLNSVAEEIARGEALAETLAFEDTELNFSHVEPTAVNRCEMEGDAIH